MARESSSFRLQGPVRDPVLQGHAIQKLHRDERLVLVLADFVDGTDIGMVQGRGGTCFAAKVLPSKMVVTSECISL
jgi:hypothetical protein